MASLEIKRIAKTFGAQSVLPGISLEVPDKEFVVILGPSGCGKSTLLRIVAGLEIASAGSVSFGGAPVDHLSPGQRNVAMVFQNYALYPHLSVAANIGFGLRRATLSRKEKRAAVQEIARLLEIESLLDRRPSELSGGQRQRVAMGRAIIRKPAVFLFDEPLSNLDARLRLQMRAEIRALHRKLPTTTLYVTHDQVEAMTMADRVVVMREGRIEQIGTPDEIYCAPQSIFVAQFIGMPAMNIVSARLDRSNSALTIAGERFAMPEFWPDEKALDGEVTLGLRPEHLSLSRTGAGLRANVDQIEPMGSETLVYLYHHGTRLCARTPPETRLASGSEVRLGLNLNRAVLFDPVTQKALYRPNPYESTTGETQWK